MKTTKLVLVILLGLATIGPAFGARETLRCTGKIITTGMMMDEVLNYCGEPQSRDTEEIPVRSGNRVTGSTKIHTWVYQRSGGKPASLTFDQDKLISIKYQ
jgi:hypothetical protein